MRTARKAPVVNVIARHRTDCQWHGQASRLLCTCPKQFQWYTNGKLNREAAPVDGKEAQRVADERTERFRKAANGITEASTNHGALLADVVAAFVNGKRAKGRTEKHADRLETELADFREWCDARGLLQLANITTPHLIHYRDERIKGHQNTRAKKCFRITGFFEYAVECGYIPRNIARNEHFQLEYAKEMEPRALSDDQFTALLDGVSKMNGRTTPETRAKMRALVLLMRHSGLSIRDALRRRREEFTKAADGTWQARIQRSKTGAKANLVLSDAMWSEILSGCNASGFLFVERWPETEHAADALVKAWGDTMARAGKRAKLDDFSSHALRHTFARGCFDAGIPTEDVARLMGDSPTVVSRFYSRWIHTREQRLMSRAVAALGLAN